MTPKTNNEWEKRLRSILDNYMPNEAMRNLVIYEYRETLSSERQRLREEIEKYIDENDDGMWAGREILDNLLERIKI